MYFGYDIRMLIFLDADNITRIKELCGDSVYLCRGIVAIIPSLLKTITRAAPFLGYAILSAVLYGIFIFAYGVRHGGVARIRFTFRPWQILLFFIGSVWLLFTTLSYWTGDQGSFHQVIEPQPGIYENMSESTLAALKVNFQRLKDAGCLSLVKQLRADVGEYSLSGVCMQGFFISRVFSQILFLLLLVMVMVSVGRAVLHRLRIHNQPILTEFVLSMGLGVCVSVAVLWLIAVIGIFWQPVGWAAIIIALLICHKHVLYWFQQLRSYQWEAEERWWSPRLFLVWFLLSYVALNFLVVVRPFPIGWDDLGSYLNQPRLMVSYGHFIASLSPFKWEYLSPLGFLLWGSESTFGITAGMEINWLAGALALLAIIAFCRRFIGAQAGILAATIYYMLPLVGHFSFADMKIDNAVFAMTALSWFCAFTGVFSTEEKDKVPTWSWFLLAGLFSGFAFAFKPTAMMGTMAMGAVVVGAMWHSVAFFGIVAIATAAYLEAWGGFDLALFSARIGLPLARPVALGVLLLITAISFGYAYFKGSKERLRATFRAGLWTLLGFAIALVPWIAHNNIQEGNIIPKLIFGAPNMLTPTLDYFGTIDAATWPTPVRSLPEELQMEKDHPACRSTSRVEELDRYWGTRQGLAHYLTLPWRSVMNADSTGYYVTTAPMLLLFPLLLLLPYFWRREQGRWFRWLFAGTVFMILQWVFLGNGVPWYGLPAFFGLVIGLELLVLKSPDLPNRIVSTTLIIISLLSCLGMRIWQFEMQQSILEYPFGKASAEVMLERTIPHYDDIADIVIERNRTLTERPYLYRIGTFIPFFIPRNLEIMALQDQQLDAFRCLNQEGDNLLTYRRLLALGLNSIVFDTNTATIETDPNGTLHQKVNQFIAFLNDKSLPIEVVVYDPNLGIAYVLLNDLPGEEADSL